MFEAQRVSLVALLEIEHPVATVRLCDGGFIAWPARGTFASRDATYGTLGSVDPAGESIGDEAPGGRFSLLPPSPAAAVSLARADAQGSPVRMWIAEVSPDTGLLIGEPELLFVGMVDTVRVVLGRNTSEVVIEYVSEAEKLFMINEGTVLSQASHQQAWPGELGFSYATNTVLAVPWGVSGGARGSTYYSGGGGGGSIFSPYVQQR